MRSLLAVCCSVLAGWAFTTFACIAWLEPARVRQLPDGSDAGLVPVAVAALVVGLLLSAVTWWRGRSRDLPLILIAAGLFALVGAVLLHGGRAGFEASAIDGVPIPPDLFGRWMVGLPVVAALLVAGVVVELWLAARARRSRS